MGLVASWSLVLAACAGDTADLTTTTATDATTTTVAPTTTPAGQLEGVRLAYSLQPGTVFQYEVTIDQHIDLTVTGDPALTAEEDMAANATVDVRGTTVLTYSVAEGPEPGTYQITISGEFTEFEASGTVDDEPINADEAPDFATPEPIDVIIVVDEQGRLVRTGELFGGIFEGDLFDLEHPGLDLGQLVGPPFPDQELAVGDSWSETIELPLFMGEEPVTTQIDSVVVGADSVDSFEVLVIETTTSTPVIEIDLADFFMGFFLAFIPDEASEEELAELESVLDELRFVMRLEPTVAESTTWFDPEAGLARKAAGSSSVRMMMDINLPDDETGDMVAFDMEMAMDQVITFTLLSGGGV